MNENTDNGAQINVDLSDRETQRAMRIAMQEAFDSYVEQSVRATAEEIQDQALLEMIVRFDAMRAAGKNVAFRVNTENSTIAIIEYNEVKVDLAEIAEEALQSVDDEMAAAGEVAVTPAFLDASATA